MPCLLGEGRLTLPSSPEAVGNPSLESLVMASSVDGIPLWVEPMIAAWGDLHDQWASSLEMVGS
jgi:hypothetical protein